MTNEEKAKMIADQCKPCTEDFYSGMYQGVLLTLRAEKDAFIKAAKWDDLDEAIGKFYEEGEDGEFTMDGDLGDIGEIAATKLGYL